ncbi:hypothetical protein [Cupriavidus sp. PET2-C1]
MRRGGVLTIAPQTLLHDQAPEQEADALQRVAMALLQFVPNVVHAEDVSVLVDWLEV